MIIEERISETENLTKKSLKNLYLLALQDGKPIYTYVWGGSMFPFIKSGDRLKIEPLGNRKIKVGDIIAVDIKGRDDTWFCAHRVIKIFWANAETVYITTGDAYQHTYDNPVTESSIIGKITEIERKNIIINLELPCWKVLNRIIGELSLKQPVIRNFLLRCLSLLIERKWLFRKIINRVTKGDPTILNTERLLLACMHGNLEKESIRKAANFIKEGVDWKRFTDAAIRNGFTLAVYSSLTNIFSYAVVPESVLNKFKSCYLLILAKSYLQHKQALEVLRILEREKIIVIPLKGTFLSFRLYGDIAMRGLGADFDILVHPKDAKRAISLIKKIGYSMDPAHTYIDLKQGAYIFNKQNAVIIDLHWELTLMFSSQERIEGFLREIRPVKYDSITYYEFKEEELLLYLCFHAANGSTYRNMKYLCDIAQLLNKYNALLNWDSIINKARSYRFTMSLYIALSRNRKLFNLQVPNKVLREIRPFWPKRIFFRIFFGAKNILRQNESKILDNHLLNYFFLELMECSSAKEYFSLFKRVFSPRLESTQSKNYILGVIRRISNLFKTIALQQ